MPESKVSEARRRPARRGEGERLRSEIVDAASRKLAETGRVADLSLRAVAREVGVATTSIYLHFDNIDELVRVVKIRYFDEFSAAMTAAAEAAGADPLARTRARAHAYVDYGLRHRGQYLAMFASEPIPPHMLPDVLYLGFEVFQAVSVDIAAIIGDEQDTQLRAVHFWTALHGVVTLRLVRRNFPWPDLNMQIDDLIIQLLRL
jgi:AcrR family transcriptional regulator